MTKLHFWYTENRNLFCSLSVVFSVSTLFGNFKNEKFMHVWWLITEDKRFLFYRYKFYLMTKALVENLTLSELISTYLLRMLLIFSLLGPIGVIFLI